MRRFLRHMFPRMFDDSTVSKSKEPSGSHQRSDKTYSRSQRKHYEQFPEPVELQLVPEGRNNKIEVQCTAVVTSKWDVDGQSETAIMEMKSFTVSSEQQDSPGHSFEDGRKG